MTLHGLTQDGGQVNPTYHSDSTEPNAKVQVELTSIHLQESKPPVVIEERDEEDLPCKWGPCLTLRCCNGCRNVKVVLLLLCSAAFVQGMVVNGFINSVISSLEKRFDLKSADTGLIASCYDIASVLCLIPVSYFGGVGSKPRWLGFGFILMGLGSVVFAIPHYTTGLYRFSDFTLTDTCVREPGNGTISATDILCGEGESMLSYYKYVLMLSQLLHGAGASPLYTLGVTYMHENVKQEWSSIYTGIFYMMSIVGPAVGFLLGGYFVRFYTDFDTVDVSQLSISQSSVSWVGAWWLGFLVGGLMAVIIGIIILGFPLSLPGYAKLKAERVSESHGGEQGISLSSSGFASLKNFPQSLKIILANPTFVLASLGAACDGMITSGVATFLPKYLEFQFSLSGSFASVIVGACIVPTGGSGMLLGGYLVKRLQLTVAGALRLALVSCVGSVLTTLAVLIRCDDIRLAGVNFHYSNSSTTGEITEIDLDSACNEVCHCSHSYFSPVCGADDVMYFTACSAGCTNYTTEDNAKVYSDCSCVGDSSRSDVMAGFATEGRCSLDCQLLAAFMVILGINIFISYTSAMPALSATLRCVPAEQCSLALGIQWIFIRCLGTIPGPILFGTVIDASCLFWLRPCEDSDDGACYYYNNVNMSYFFLGIILGLRVLSLIFYLSASALYKPPPDAVKEQDVNDSMKKVDGTPASGDR